MSTMAKAVTEHISVRIWRGGEDGQYQTFSVPLRENQTVLDIVTWIQRYAEPTVAYRFSCRVGMCGSCGMTVNGQPRWTCRTHISKVIEDGKVEIGPLANLPVIKDLAVDMTPFFKKWQKAQGTFSGSIFPGSTTRHEDMPRIAPRSAGRVATDAAIECINCGVCFAACDTVRWNSDYLGPAALNRAWTLANDERDGAHRNRLRAVAKDGGCHACHSHQSCEQLCPKGLNPTTSIAGLKRLTMKAYIRGEL